MKIAYFSLWLLVALSVIASAQAPLVEENNNNANPPKPVEVQPAPIQEQPVPVPDNRPTNMDMPKGPADQQTPPAPADDLPAPLDEEKSRQISRYFDEALQNYRDILSQQETAQAETTEKRIENNEKLLDEQKNKLDTSKTSLRKVQMEYIRRFLGLKNSYQQGNIDKKTYDFELDKLAREYKFQMNSLTGDVNFWKTQQGSTAERLKTLQDVNRLNKIMMQKKGIKSSQPQRKSTELENVVQKINNIGCFQVQNEWSAPEIR